MRGLKETISKVLQGIASVIVAGVVLLIIAGITHMVSLGFDWAFTGSATPTFIETLKWSGVVVALCALAGEFRELIRD